MLAATAMAALALCLLHLHGAHGIDFQVYRLGGSAVLHGRSPYAVASSHGLVFTYPPFAALLFVPFALVPLPVGYAAWTVLLAGAATLFARQHLSRWITSDLRLVLATLSLGLLEPVWQTFFLGQIDLLLVVAVGADLLLLSGRRRGVLTGVAAGIKLTPGLFGLMLLAAGERRDAARVLGAFLATVVVGVVVLPGPSVTYWLHDVLDASRVGDQTFANDQSLHAALLRLSSSDGTHLVWLCLATGVLLLALAAGKAWWRLDERRVAVAAAATGALLVSPVSWTHHWVWCLPIALALDTATVRAGVARWRSHLLAGAWLAAFVVAPALWVPRHRGRELSWSPVETVVGNTYVLLGVMALLVLAWSARRVRWRRF